MTERPAFQLERAIKPDTNELRWVITDRDGQPHRIANDWLDFLIVIRGQSLLTIRSYGAKVAAYLSWCEGTKNWRSVHLADLVMFRNVVRTTPYSKTNGKEHFRSEANVGLWMSAVRSFYIYAQANGYLSHDVVSQMLQVKFFRAGTPQGGEHGKERLVLNEALKTPVQEPVPIQWIECGDARQRLAELELNVRDRFLIDLLSKTGIRVGEALSLFVKDVHVGGGGRGTACRHTQPHFHVRTNNPVENGAHAKGCSRMIELRRDLVEGYVDYLLERRKILGDGDRSPHLFVNLYCSVDDLGKAMSYNAVKKLMDRCSRRIDYDITGPHMLRHTLATRLVRGIDCDQQSLDVVAELLGHASFASTKVYLHDDQAAMRSALESLEPRVINIAEGL